MFFPYFYLLMFYQCGTVFQTAFLTFLVIPRLRPRLLSLRSVLSSRQLLLSRSPSVPYCACSPSALSPCSKSITDNLDATDLFFSRIFLFGLFFSFGFICACWVLGFSRIYLSLWTICGLFLL